ncbi:hypothetical protein THC_1023 [Caldimicrobium thiodismutans]|uniref:Probable molybdenum cofactor guanylyltransferase n=1 Tax=Caldimicrobium thiodismutans TaxID=1653476 RepID=A0A0U5AY61_9BACT|nr:NTP transferase domain-containing protein [Caldimicrobium thiodismutans]BAU23407.1 hypothetical protein THC_1023 [Caldimicrobium thiodismutans]
MKKFGLILAGGKGKRIGGNKPLKLLAGKPLLYWALNPYLQLNIPILISVESKEQKEVLKDSLEKYLGGTKKLEFIFDDKNFKNLGPLSGLYAAFNYIDVEALLLVSAVDQPLIKIDLLRYLLEETEKIKTPALVFEKEEELEPLPGAYNTILLSELKSFLTLSPRKSFKAFLSILQGKGLLATSVFWHKIDPKGKCFLNINDLEELTKIETCFFQKKT